MNKGAAMSHPDPAQGDKADPYEQGIEAAHTGLSAAHCPYEDDSPEGEAWMSPPQFWYPED